VARAAKPVEIVAACAVAVVACCRFRRRVRQPPQGKSQGVDDALWERGEFLLARFDGRTLAALREEGPPVCPIDSAAPVWTAGRRDSSSCVRAAAAQAARAASSSGNASSSSD
jgi:hypothetical protein